jgi:hypothetical protein
LKRKMERKKKYSRTGFPGFMRYMGNNLTGEEKNSFERELQKDPFAEEAEEGLSSLDTDALKNDMDLLSGRLKRRTSGNRKIIFYRIAASVAVLLTLTTVYMLLHKSEVPNTSVEPVRLEISRSEPVKAEKKTEIPKQKMDQVILVDSKRRASEQAVPSGQIAQNNLRKIIPDTIKEEEKISPAELVIADNLSNISPSAPMSRSMTANIALREVRGKVISDEDKLPVPGASIQIRGTSIGTISDSKGDFRLMVPEKTDAPLVASFIGMETKEVQISHDSVLKVSLSPSKMALSEVVVTGYGAKSRSNATGAAGGADRALEKKDAINIEYTHPEPVAGKKSFDDYIETNIRRPEILKAGDKAVVVLSFIVRNNGIPDSIQIVRSPGEIYSTEAIRLIKEGPKWKPATENGNPIEEEARVRIVFR